MSVPMNFVQPIFLGVNNYNMTMVQTFEVMSDNFQILKIYKKKTPWSRILLRKVKVVITEEISSTIMEQLKL
jgi:hypothetical protein